MDDYLVGHEKVRSPGEKFALLWGRVDAKSQGFWEFSEKSCKFNPPETVPAGKKIEIFAKENPISEEANLGSWPKRKAHFLQKDPFFATGTFSWTTI